ncbi:MAG: rhodanese [Desulfuromonas sp.]|nr:MAG: rhodanese [Desulfuromonas sp.]
MKVGFRELVERAEAEIETISVEEALNLYRNDEVVMVDLRDIRELYREGMIPGAFHAPRGLLEFWVDPNSPYYNKIFSPGKRFVFYCNLGWRSALATQVVQQMGLENVCHINGGFDAWKAAAGPVAEKVKR